MWRLILIWPVEAFAQLETVFEPLKEYGALGILVLILLYVAWTLWNKLQARESYIYNLFEAHSKQILEINKEHLSQNNKTIMVLERLTDKIDSSRRTLNE